MNAMQQAWRITSPDLEQRRKVLEASLPKKKKEQLKKNLKKGRH